MRRLPILCYHAVEDGPAPFCIAPDVFARHIDVLARLGCVTVTTSEVAASMSARRPLPPRAVAITFDDGYASVFEHAYPVMAEHGFLATVFPVTAHLGGSSAWNPVGAQMRLLDAETLMRLRAEGWEIGGHTHTHRPMPSLGDAEVRDEIDTSTRILSELVGGPLVSFAYPYGAHDVRIRAEAARAYGICLSVGTRHARPGDPLDRTPRIDAWYLRRPLAVRHVHDPAGALYLAARGVGRSLRALLT